jgi:Protein of unknown function (DUF3829)
MVQSATAAVRKPSRRLLLIGAAALALPVNAFPARAFTAPNELAAARRKLDAYTELYRATHGFASAWRRYLQFVDYDAGPRGREARLNGLVAPPALTAEIAAAERLLATPPQVAEADRAAKALIDFYREAAPMMAEAAAFFETYAPKDDQGRAGQTHHRRMRSTMTFAVDARADLFKAADALRGELEPKELAALAAKARGAHYHVRLASVEARKVRDALPVAPGPFDAAEFTRRVEAFAGVADACRRFDAAGPGSLGMFRETPTLFHMAADRLRQQIAGRTEAGVATQTDILALHTAYAQVVSFADLHALNYP